MWWASLGGLFLLVIPLYQLMATGLWGAIVGFAVLGLLYVPQLATISATFPAMFTTPVRFAGLSIAYTFSTSPFGCTAPAFHSWLIGLMGHVLVTALVLMASCLIRSDALPVSLGTTA